MMTINKKTALKTLWDYVVITLGALLFSIAWVSFMIPNGMSSGGIMGLCTMVQFATHGAVSASFLYFVTNAVLIVLAILVFGIGFGFKTIYTIVVVSVFEWLLSDATWLMSIPGEALYIREDCIIPLVAGLLEAVGIGLIIRYGGSSGGSDIIALIVGKFYPVPMGKVFLVTDVMVITAIILLPDKSFADAIYGYEMAIVFSVVIDYVVVGSRSTIQLNIFSDKYKEIADYVSANMDRGVTLLRAQGWYTKQEKSVLLILMRRNQLSEISRVVKEIDPKAFMSVAKVASVYGEGFDEIKAGVKKKQQ